jgi:hypothetical protein
MSEPIKIVAIHRPVLSCDNRMDGGVNIKLDDFVYVSINYDYRYTDNAMCHALAERIIAYLNGTKP